ncbi:hypothetical protein SLE2022_093570 [Rubroshorea leprosula]
MGHRCCSKQKVKRGLWSPEEDEKLIKHITEHGHGSWSSVPKLAGLQRCGKSCRLRWINYLRPDLKRGSFTAEEEQIIIDVHRILGNRWAQIAKHLPGRTDNEVKNFWNSCIKKKLLSQGLDPKTHNLLSSHKRANRVNTSSSSSSQMQEQTFSVFNGSHSMEIINPPVITLPSAALSPPMPIPMTIPNSEYQNPNVIWNGNDQNYEEPTIYPHGSSIDNTLISSLSSSLSGFNIMDEGDCILGIDGAIEPCRLPGMEGQVLQQQEKEQSGTIVCNDNLMDKIEGEMHEMGASFDSTSFDLGFVESTLMSGAMCRDNLTSMEDYNFAWTI